MIDDYHLVASATVDDGIERLIELAPDNLTLVLLTRWDQSDGRLPELQLYGPAGTAALCDRLIGAEGAFFVGQEAIQIDVGMVTA